MKKSVMMIMAAIAMLSMSCKGGSSTSGEGTAETTEVEVPEYEKLDERATLVKIFETVGGSEWSDYNKTGWCTDAPLNEWKNVKLNQEGKVEELYLSLSLKNPLPPEIQNLESLKKLHVSFDRSVANPVPTNVFMMPSLEILILQNTNSEEGAGIVIPETVNLPNLKTLDMLHVESDLHQLSQMPKLEVLSISSGPADIPDEIGTCTNLKNLIWYPGNANTKPLTAELKKLTSLEVLDICFNTTKEQGFDEKIPDFIWDFTNLKKLWLSNVAKNNGDLDGAKVAKMTKVENLKLSRNGITNIPEEFFALPALKYFSLEKNAIKGEIPASIGNSNLMSISLNDNPELGGKIPESMGKLEGLYSLSLGNTAIDQNIPASMKKLPKFDSFSSRIF
jgi:Leucine-rich repeat (LRR) protein